MWKRMFDKRVMIIGASALALAACSEAEEQGAEFATQDSVMAESVDMASADTEAAAEESEGGELSALASRPDIPVNLPRMAYIYSYGFSMPGADIADLQQRHADMCEAAGPYSCQILSLSHSGEEDGYATGRLELAVVADKARSFASELSSVAERAGGEQVTADIKGEDLAKQMVDTEARLRSRTELRDRMMEVLRTRKGDVAELVEAERQVARINEEIDQARSWMKEMQGRVAYTRVNLDYRSTTPPASDFLSPVEGALGSVGSIMGTIMALMVYLLAVGLPIGLAVWGVHRMARRFGFKEPSEA